MFCALRLLSAIAAASASDAALRGGAPGRLLQQDSLQAVQGCADGHVLEPVPASECPTSAFGAVAFGACSTACPGTICAAVENECGLPRLFNCLLVQGTGLWRKTFRWTPTVPMTVSILGDQSTGRRYLSFDSSLNVNLVFEVDDSGRQLWNFLRNDSEHWYHIVAHMAGDGPGTSAQRYLTSNREGTNVYLDSLIPTEIDGAGRQRWIVPVGFQTPPLCCSDADAADISSICFVFDWATIRILDQNAISPGSDGQLRTLLSTDGVNVDMFHRNDRSGNQRWVIQTVPPQLVHACSDGYLLEPVLSNRCPEAPVALPSCSSACPGDFCNASGDECGLPALSNCVTLSGTGLWRKTLRQSPTVQRTVTIFGGGSAGRKLLSFDDDFNVNLAREADGGAGQLWNFAQDPSKGWYHITAQVASVGGGASEQRYLTTNPTGDILYLNSPNHGSATRFQRWVLDNGFQTPYCCSEPGSPDLDCWASSFTAIRLFDQNALRRGSDGRRPTTLSVGDFVMVDSDREDFDNQRWVITHE